MTDNRTTELLRKLLDERGARYEKSEDDTTIYYDGDGNRYTYNVNPDSGWAQLFGYNLTPEQAIAATLGSGTCENLSKMNLDGVAGYHFTCSRCGLSVCASMGIGEVDLSEPHTFSWKTDGAYEFERCPRCGRMVEV